MADSYLVNSAEFAPEDAEQIARIAIHQVLNESTYNAKKVNEWTNGIVNHCLKELQGLNKPFKYVITCLIMQKNGAGMHSSCSMHWDTTKDGVCKVPWQNQSMHCVVTIFGAAVVIDDPHED